LPDYLEVGEVLDQHTRIFLLTTTYIVIPEIALIVLWGLFFSHRLAGPLFSMSRKLKEIANGGAPEPVRLRKGDLLPDFADQLNEAIAALSRQRDELDLALKDIRGGKVRAGEERLEKIIRPGPIPGSSSTETPPPAN
jgi:nitrogen fixation/metabolism regulation signal transduction histidine kinase